MKKVITFLCLIALFLSFSCKSYVNSDSPKEPEPTPEPEPSAPPAIYHKIEYDLNSGEWAENYFPPVRYKEGTEVILPDATKISRSDMYFEGWYDNFDFEGEPLTTISAEMKTDVSLCARWVAPQTISLENNYTPTITYNITQSNATVYAQMPSTCKSVTEEIYKYGIYIDDICVTVIKSGSTYCNYNFSNYVKSLTPGKHIIMVTVEIFDVPGSYSSTAEFEI